MAPRPAARAVTPIVPLAWHAKATTKLRLARLKVAGAAVSRPGPVAPAGTVAAGPAGTAGCTVPGGAGRALPLPGGGPGGPGGACAAAAGGIVAATTTAPSTIPSRLVMNPASSVSAFRSALRWRTSPRRAKLPAPRQRYRTTVRILSGCVERLDLGEDGLGDAHLLVVGRVRDPVEPHEVAVSDRDAGELQAFPVAHVRRAVDRDGEDGRAGVEHQAADAPSRAVRKLTSPRAGAFEVHDDRAAAREHVVGGDERFLVVEAAADREHAAVRVDPLHRRLEELRLGHERHAPADEGADEEVVHEREVVGCEDQRPVRGHLLGRDAAGAEERPRHQRGADPNRLVDPVRLACPRARVEPVEMLLRPRIAVDLRLELGELLPHGAADARGCAALGGAAGRDLRPHRG